MGTMNKELSGWGSSNKKVDKRVMKTGSGGTIAPKYRVCSNTFSSKINSFKTLFNQTRGAAKCQRPSTAVLNTFANWVNKGAVVQTCTNVQIARWARSCKKNFNARNVTPTTCRNILCSTFGKSTIKAVAKTKTGSFMVATSPTLKGRPFCFPK